jgi:NACalpha-BTF3-like transcription factor
MLKAHQASIDLEHDVLRIKGRTVKFLPEHELPDNARTDHSGAEAQDNNPSSSTPTPQNQRTPARFPGSGNSLGGGGGGQSQPPSRGTPVGGSGSRGTQLQLQQRQQQQQPTSLYAEKDIQTIMSMGVSREMALQTLEAAGGNVDLAASLLF